MEAGTEVFAGVAEGMGMGALREVVRTLLHASRMTQARIQGAPGRAIRVCHVRNLRNGRFGVGRGLGSKRLLGWRLDMGAIGVLEDLERRANRTSQAG